MDEQTSIRLPRELARTLTQRAKERGVSRSQLVRDALEAYLNSPPPSLPVGAMIAREGNNPFIGSLRLRRDGSADPLVGLIRERNWRE